jgi:hypothetical protein
MNADEKRNDPQITQIFADLIQMHFNLRKSAQSADPSLFVLSASIRVHLRLTK